MSYTPQSSIVGTRLGTPGAWVAWASKNGVKRLDEFERYVRELYRLAGLRKDKGPQPHKLIAQMLHETGGGTSDAWEQCLNPAGIGVTSDAKRLWFTFRDGVHAARAHYYHASEYSDYPVAPEIAAYRSDDPRAGALPERFRGTRHTLASYGTDDPVRNPSWAVDLEYGEKWAKWLNRVAVVFAGTPDPPEEEPPVGMYTIPGLPGGPIAFSFRVNIGLIPASRTYQRPGIRLSGAFETCQHMTANWGSDAPAEARYFRSGAEGRQASVHACIDDVVCEILLMLNEVGWHAGDGAGPGNMSTIALELCQLRAMVNDPTRWRRARRNAAEFMAKVAARYGAPPPGKFHHDYSGKWCPAVLLNNATWVREYHEDYRYFYEMERKAMTGDPAPGKPAPEPVIYYIGDTIKAIVSLNLRQRASTSAPIVATLAVNTEAVVNGPFEWADSYGWLPVTTKQGNGFVAMGENGTPFIEKVKSREEPKPAPAPVTYVPVRPIRALLDTDVKKNDTAPGIVTDDLEQDFVFVADVIEFETEHVAAEMAVENPKAVKAPFQPGDRAVAAWLVKSKETGTWWYVLTGPDNEWVRVAYEGTVRISDAPLLPDDPDVDDVIATVGDTVSGN